jgi:hypothetical protein
VEPPYLVDHTPTVSCEAVRVAVPKIPEGA